MSPPTHEYLPPAYRAHRGVLVTVLVLVALAAGYRLVPLAGDGVEFVLSLIRSVRQVWVDLDWDLFGDLF